MMVTNYLTGEQQVEEKFLREDLQHVLIMRPDTVSDVVMLAPALRALRESLPHAEMTLLTSDRGCEAKSLLPWIDDVMVYPALWQDITEASLLNLRKDMAFIERLRARRVTMAMIFTASSESPWPSAYACYLAGIPHRIGFAKDVHGSALSHILLPPGEDVHGVDRNLNLLQTLGIYEANRQMDLPIPAEIENRAHELLMENGITPGLPYLVLAPQARRAAEFYDPHHFAAAARILSAQTEHLLIIVGSAEGREAIEPVLQLANENLYGNVHSLVGKTSLPELAAVIRGARLTITNRSAVMHLAEAFQCPSVVLYPGTDPIQPWAPRGASTRILSRHDSCSPCQGSDCPAGMKCLDIRPEEVAIAALELLGGQAGPPATYHILQGSSSDISAM
jgi:ADP-heptose:LPS heptosyltransferase